MVERFGTERIMANSAGDWGPSDPMSVPDFIRTLRARGHDGRTIHRLVYENPLRFFAQSAKFDFQPPLPLS
jgi:hypothetical protein